MFRKINYYSSLVHYLNEFKTVCNDSEKELTSVLDYLKSVLNEKSATDHNAIISLERLLDKFSYASKYLDVTLDFYENEYAK